VIGHYNATYFCGHEHIVNVQRYPALGTSNQPYQVIVGARGSPFDDTLANNDTAEPVQFRTPWDRHYGGRGCRCMQRQGDSLGGRLQ